MNRACGAFAIAWLALVSGCARLPATGVTPLQPATLSELRGYVLDHKADVDQFRMRGPFEVATHKDHELRLSATERIDADLYLSAPAEKAPLAILLHGHDNSKEDHAYQALHLATWGIHSLAVTLPNNGPWVGNGRTLARIVAFVHRHPETIDSRIDVNKIILVGHSFGGAAVAIALAEGAPAAGGILLDPAGTGKDLPKFLRKIDKPVMLLGADERFSPVRDRRDFYLYIRSGIAEVSITDATHEDAQFPLEPAPQGHGADSSATEELQITFVSALTAAAFSLGHTGNFDFAWAGFGDAIASGKFFDALKK
jgi:pimeloyl-ACP methyl ester carboxylesterase